MFGGIPFSQWQGSLRFQERGPQNVLLSVFPSSELCSHLLNFLIDICVRCMYACAIIKKKAVLENSVFIKENYLWGMYKTVKKKKATKKKKKHIRFAQ